VRRSFGVLEYCTISVYASGWRAFHDPQTLLPNQSVSTMVIEFGTNDAEEWLAFVHSDRAWIAMAASSTLSHCAPRWAAS
jgi:hypothetical protein